MPKWGYSIIEEMLNPEKTAKASGRELKVSRKAAREVCKAVKGMSLVQSKEFLREVMIKKRPVPYTRYTKKLGHKAGMAGRCVGRFPIKTAEKILHVIEAAQANAENKGLDVDRLRIMHAAAYQGIKLKRFTPRAHGRASPKFDTMKRTEIDEFLQKKLERAGYGGVNLSKTPLGTHVVVYAMRPGLVIGRGGETIKELASALEQNFKVSNPQISVSEIEVPEFNAHVVANRVASALERGVHFRRAGFWALNQVMEAGALGAEIVISGKLTTERARFEKFKAGHFPIVGDPALKALKTAEAHIQLKPGIIGVRVKIMPSDAYFPDKVTIMEPAPEEEQVTVQQTPAPPTPAPVETKTKVEPETDVQTKEVTDEPKPEEKKQ